MQAQSFNKITAAGFTFYRDRWDSMTNTGDIWKATDRGSWRLHSQRAEYKSKAALSRAMKALIDNDPMAVTEF